MEGIDFQSHRSRKARLGARISKTTVIMLYVTTFLFVLVGIGLLLTGFPWGWVSLGASVIPLMYALWDTYDLENIPASNGQGVDQRLESSVLGSLSRDPSPRDIARAVLRSQSARFLINRFELSSTVIQDLSSDQPEDAAVVWRRAEEYRSAEGASVLRGDMVVASLCVTQPSVLGLLPHIQLDPVDLTSGIQWYSRVRGIISYLQKSRITGGIARDWDFGYANLLEHFGANLSQQAVRNSALYAKLDSHQAAVDQLRVIFSGDGRQNVAIVGKLGTGKSTVAQTFAESLMTGSKITPTSLRFRQVIRLDAGSIIRYAHNRNQLEDIVQRLFVEAYKAKNIILFLDDAQLFFEDGNGSVDLSSALLPIVEGGRLRIFMAMDEQAYLRIAQRSPSLASVLNRINVEQASEADTMKAMQDQIIRLESEHKVTYTYQGLKEAYRLSERYVYDIAQPGRAVRLLEQAARQADNGFVTARSVAAAVEQSSGVKVSLSAGDTNERDKLLNLESHIHERMVNQSRAVSVVSDALRRARAGVRNEKRPIGTFLFLGPTGVGKTELAKSLAEVYFGGINPIVRIDLNEYVRPEDVSRLIADGANDPHGLTASLLKQPFSVVLLDEIEKAHPQVLMTLLQMLDEGILRDINNREVSFREAIVIATSNAGSERISQLINEGKTLEEFEENIVDELIDGRQFKPEFLNRFDEIVVFRPLTTDELEQVVKRMLKEVNSSLANQKIQVELTAGAIKKLASIGYDPRLGARPMRRVIQRSVENLVAKRILEGSVQPGQTVSIGDTDITLDK